jgi:hypothetical protein
MGEENNEYPPERKAKEEALKLFYDTMKHLTTLSTGSILVLLAFLEKIFTRPRWKALIVLTLVSLIISTLAALAAMLYISEALESVVINEERKNYAVASYLISVSTFLLGLGILITFTIKNLF